ncbi:hypothetical protein P171DRAFT_174731 [Karstenula rhodostoma CBS 690.94]|uniref:Uncharacterized protein n=1 Tax=Karstenula rhodostoma CBS 690.94 TaxID=1392251 RepID=A0A9P4P7C9_9PLEO|nr:hypothetical protein P171DRAFT_174731 [Karstenula rhodostoma CBS 690.94]
MHDPPTISRYHTLSQAPSFPHPLILPYLSIYLYISPRSLPFDRSPPLQTRRVPSAHPLAPGPPNPPRSPSSPEPTQRSAAAVTRSAWPAASLPRFASTGAARRPWPWPWRLTTRALSAPLCALRTPRMRRDPVG